MFLHQNFGFYLRLFMTRVKTQLNSKYEISKALSTFFIENSVKVAVYIVIVSFQSFQNILLFLYFALKSIINSRTLLWVIVEKLLKLK